MNPSANRNKLDFIYDDLMYYFIDDTSNNGINKSLALSKKIQKEFNIDKNILWINLRYYDLYNQDFDSRFNKIQTSIAPDTEVIVLWMIGYHMPINWDIIQNLNKFCSKIQQPVLLCLGALGNWDHAFVNQLDFTIWKVPFYEYESYLYNTNKDCFLKSNIDKFENNIDRSKKFLFMGTKDYPNRKFILSNIINNNQLTNGYVSYKQVWDKPLSPELYSPEQIHNIINVANSIDMFLPLPTLDNSVEYTEMSRTLLLDSYVNMVTDTYFESAKECTFLSEKVFNAIAHWQMFIVMAPPGTLAYLKTLGYRTFEHIIDESYDSIEDDYNRIISVNNAFINFISQPLDTIRQQYIDSLPIVEHNRQVLLSCRFEQEIIDRLS